MSRKASKIFLQSGVIPYRVIDGKLEVLLITTRNSQAWAIPKGDISNGMTPADSAAKEAWEEAGVVGEVYPTELGSYKYSKRGKTYRVKTFLLPVELVSEDYPEAFQRQRQWLEISLAVKRVKKASLKRILNRLK